MRVYHYAMFLWLVTLGESYAQTAWTCADWARVTRWKGTVTLTGSGSGSYVDTQSGCTVTCTTRQSVTATYTVGPLDPQANCTQTQPVARWYGSYADTSSVNDTCSACGGGATITGSGGNTRHPLWDASRAGGLTAGRLLEIDPNAGAYAIPFSPALLNTVKLQDATNSLNPLTFPIYFVGPINDPSWLRMMADVALPPNGPTLSGSRRFRAPAGHGAPADWELTWKFTGSADELVIEPDTAYPTWMPEAGFDESTPGNDIAIRARISGPNNQAPSVKAKKISFELVGTSRQPGILMNYPPRAVPACFHCGLLPNLARDTHDLQFYPPRNPNLTVSGEGGQKAETPDGQYTEATAVVTSFDYGGWSELRVTAELQDGQKLVGTYAGEPGLRLPKRAANSLIADVWKERMGVSGLADDDDGETAPEGLAGCIGDGFTLYEEYRGFLENDIHIFGNPSKKDLFIWNRAGPVLDEGIWVFAESTGLEVHKDLISGSEYDPRRRIINDNYSDRAPHRVDQHGLTIAVCGEMRRDLGRTYLSKLTPGARGRPKDVDQICINDPDVGYIWDVASPTDQWTVLAKAVAHELSHAVGVEHHGTGDYQAAIRFLYPDDLRNPAGRPLFRFEDGQAVTILDELSGEDIAPQYFQTILESEQKMRKLLSGPPFNLSGERLERDIQGVKSLFQYVGGPVGVTHGEHSGEELCYMRSHFARYYEAYDRTSSEKTYYIIPSDKGERSGVEFCGSRTGTGINATDRTPRPRYLDAAPTGGQCSKWVCVNDVYPLLNNKDAVPMIQP